GVAGDFRQRPKLHWHVPRQLLCGGDTVRFWLALALVAALCAPLSAQTYPTVNVNGTVSVNATNATTPVAGASFRLTSLSSTACTSLEVGSHALASIGNAG